MIGLEIIGLDMIGLEMTGLDMIGLEMIGSRNLYHSIIHFTPFLKETRKQINQKYSFVVLVFDYQFILKVSTILFEGI